MAHKAKLSLIPEILALQARHHGSLKPGSDLKQRRKLPTGIPPLDRLLGGGFVTGTVSEWGLPPGRGGRRIITAILSHILSTRRDDGLLWAYGTEHLTVYPPAWAANGLSLDRIHFARAPEPARELKPVFLDPNPLFRLVVLDAPARFSRDDMVFITDRARRHHQTVFLLRNYFLSQKRGNVWAKIRLNGWLDPKAGSFRIRTVRGLSPGLISTILPDQQTDTHL